MWVSDDVFCAARFMTMTRAGTCSRGYSAKGARTSAGQSKKKKKSEDN